MSFWKSLIFISRPDDGHHFALVFHQLNDGVAWFDEGVVWCAGAAQCFLVGELFRVDDGTTLWRGEYEAGLDLDRSALLLGVALEVTGVLDLPR